MQATADWTLIFDQTNGLRTGRLSESYAYIRKLAAYSPKAKVIRYGTSPQGREMLALLISDEKNFSPEQWAKSDKPTIFIQNGIHSGEIEGKDASLILARELLVEKKHAAFLKNVNIVLVPVFSVDAHERFGPYNRVNQNGPVEMGWRATAQNLNLNRDWMKADSPEMRGQIGLVQRYRPDFFFDNHTTDGSDYQYVLTLGIPWAQTIAPKAAQFGRDLYALIKTDCEKAGFPTAPYFGMADRTDPSKGISVTDYSPRFSHGYLATMDRPGMLVETHVLKPYKQRVEATHRVMIETIQYCIANKAALKQMNRDSDAAASAAKDGSKFVLSSRLTAERTPFTFLGYEYAPKPSAITGDQIAAWRRDKPTTVNTFVRWNFEPETIATAPAAYAVPPEWQAVNQTLALHGLMSYTIGREAKTFGQVTRLSNVKFPSQPFESRFQPNYQSATAVEPVTLPVGTRIYPINQKNAKLLVHLLAPNGPDSLLKWGSFNPIFEQKEYAEDYAMEPYAKKMLEADASLKDEFEKRLQEPAFKNSASARLNFFFERSPFFDKALNRYPVVMFSAEQLATIQKNSRQ